MKSCMSISPYTSASESSSDVPLQLLQHDELGDVRSHLLEEHLEALHRRGLPYPLSLHALRSKRFATPFSTRLRSF